MPEKISVFLTSPLKARNDHSDRHFNPKIRKIGRLILPVALVTFAREGFSQDMFIRIKFYPSKNFTMTLHGHMSCFSNIFAVKIILMSIFLFTFSSIYRAKASGMNYQPWKKIIQILSVTRLRISTG